MDTNELHWLAGIVEGEGTFHMKWRKRTEGGSTRLDIGIAVTMTDEDVIRRAHRIAGVGTATFRPTKKKNNQDCWRWAVNKKADVAALAMTLWPLMGRRRQERIEELIAAWKSEPPIVSVWETRTEKGCYSCKQVKPLSEFHKNGTRVQTYCKGCTIMKQKARR